MFNFSGSEIIFLLLLALIILGPEKLPDAIRSFGKTYSEFKKMTTGFQSELKNALDEPMREMRETADAFKQAASFDVAADMLQGKMPPSPEVAGPTSANGAEPPIAPAPAVSAEAPASPSAPSPAPAAADGQRDQDLPSFDSIVMGREHTYRPATAPEPEPELDAVDAEPEPDAAPAPDADSGDDQAETR